jgi:signal peptidase
VIVFWEAKLIWLPNKAMVFNQTQLKLVSKIWLITKIGLLVFVLILSFISALTIAPFRSPLKPFVVTSGSMRPKIKEGSIVFVRRGSQKLAIGDVITYIKPDNFKENITHRITAIEDKSGKPIYKTKGDANNGEDPWTIGREKIWGRVAFHLPFIGYLVAFSKTRLGVILLIVVPAILIVLNELFVIFQEVEKIKKRMISTPSTHTPATPIILLLFTLTYSIQSTLSAFNHQATTTRNQISSKCWAPPTVPVLSYPQNRTIVNLASLWGNNPYLDWEDSTSQCPQAGEITYQYQSYSDPGLTQLVYQSGWLNNSSIPAPGTPDGLYYWRVRSQDSLGQISNFSSPWLLTVDRSRPQSTIASTVPVTPQSHLTIDYQVTDDHPDVVQLCYSFQLQPWVCPSQYRQNLPSGSFNFEAPSGDGLYRFLTVATDQNGNPEDKNNNGIDDDLSSTELESIASSLPTSVYALAVDTHTPNSNLNLAELSSFSLWSGQSLTTNGSFENSLTGWQTSGSGDHQVVTTGIDSSAQTIAPVEGSHMLQLGFNQNAATTNSSDSILQLVPIPNNLSSSLSLWFRVISQDIVDYDTFRIQILDSAQTILETVMATGASESGGTAWTTDTGWRSIVHSLAPYAGQTIGINFVLTDANPDTNLNTWAYIDAVAINTLDPRVGDTAPVVVEAHDTNSGVAVTTQSQTNLNPGENQLTYQSSDNLGNQEATQSASVLTMPSVVLNRLAVNLSGDESADHGTPLSHSGEWVELYNNSNSAVDITGWQLVDSQGHILTFNNTNTSATTIASKQGIIVYRQGDPDFSLDNQSGSLTLKTNLSQLVDSTSYAISNPQDGDIWQRQPSGLGTWGLLAQTPEFGFNLSSRLSVNKITLSLFNVPASFGTNPTDNLAYEVQYQNGAGAQGFAGSINPSTIIETKADRDFYLGTCSGSVCTPDSGLVPNFTVNITGQINGTSINLSRTFNF